MNEVTGGMSNVTGMISSIADQQGKVNDLMGSLSSIEDPKELLNASMDLMVKQQRLSTLTDAFTKTMKANHDSQKAAIQNMH